MRYSIFLFSNLFSIFIFVQIIRTLKYMIIYKIENFENLIFFEIEQLQKFFDCRNCKILELYGAFQIVNFSNFPNY